jgi:xylose isomerase
MGEFFPNIDKIVYVPFDKPSTEKIMAFRHYNPEEVVLGKKMKEWLRFSVCYWHTFRTTGSDPFGSATITRTWDDGSNTVENACNRLRAAFEFMHKLGAEYWTFHDRDIAPEGHNLEETNKNLDQVVELACQLQKETGIKLLWGTANLFSHPRYMNGAATNPDAHVFAHAAAQVKKVMDVTLKLGGDNFVFWGGREGYQSILNSDIKKELDHLAAFFRMAVEYKTKIGAKFQFLIEPKPREPTKHQYDYDAQTVISFLKSYGLDQHFKLNIEPNHTTLAGHDYEHDIIFASKLGFLGSIDSNTGDQALGWDTDQFPMDPKKTALVMKTVIEQGGIAPGGLNFDSKIRRESTDTEDMFIAHIGAMDAFARGLKIAAHIIQGDIIPKLVKERYNSYETGIGQKIEKGEATFEQCEEFILKNGEPTPHSGKQEKFELLYNYYT